MKTIISMSARGNSSEIATLCEKFVGEKALLYMGIKFYISACTPDPDEPELGLRITGKFSDDLTAKRTALLFKALSIKLKEFGSEYDTMDDVNRILSFKGAGKELIVTVGVNTK